MSVLNNDDVYDLLEAKNDLLTFEPGLIELESPSLKPAKKKRRNKCHQKFIKCLHFVSISMKARHFFFTFLTLVLISALRITIFRSDFTRKLNVVFSTIERHVRSMKEDILNEFIGAKIDEEKSWEDRYLEAIGKKPVGFEENEWSQNYNIAIGKVVVATTTKSEDTGNVVEREDENAWSEKYLKAVHSHRTQRGWELSN